jgi:asparagine N-glycosylation enzyme membrane subunit Stt3
MRYIRVWREYKRQFFTINPDIIDVLAYGAILVFAQTFKHPYIGVGVVLVLMFVDLIISYREGKKLVEEKYG